jgi:hypothetical protein
MQVMPSGRRAAAGTAALLLAAVSLAAYGCQASSVAPATYYLSPSGNDAAAGTSPAAAWRSLSKASSAVLPPGSRLLLDGGQRFTGSLILGRQDAGDAAAPVLIGSYGRSRATIAAAGGPGITVNNTAGVNIRGLTITGSSAARRGSAGINIFSDLPGRRKLDHVSIAEVNISGFANGISIGTANGGAGFRDIQVSNSALHDNADSGLVTYGPPFRAAAPAYANEDMRITHVIAYHNYGNPAVTSHSTGNGIVLGSVRGGTVEWSTAGDNGGAGGSHQGPEGIWAYNSAQVTIEHDLSYGNQTHDHVDGNGFGLDQNTSDSCLEYDLSYGNAGAGYLLYTGLDNGATTDDSARFNISSGDAQDQNHRFGGITVSGETRNAAVYQNTVVMRAQPDGASPALKLGAYIRDVTARNNIFVVPSGPVVIDEAGSPTTTALLQGNDYYATTAPGWSIRWGTVTYPSLAAWRSATGQEIADGRPAGFTANPGLTGPVVDLQAKTPAATAARGFALRPGSPLLRAGLDLGGLFGVRPGGSTSCGGRAPVQHPSLGAQ